MAHKISKKFEPIKFIESNHLNNSLKIEYFPKGTLRITGSINYDEIQTEMNISIQDLFDKLEIWPGVEFKIKKPKGNKKLKGEKRHGKRQ